MSIPLYPILFDIATALSSVIWFYFTTDVTMSLCGNCFAENPYKRRQNMIFKSSVSVKRISDISK